MAPILIFYAAKFVDKTAAEDIVHDVFLRVWQKQASLVMKERLKSYLFKSVQNSCLDYLKHLKVSDDYFNASITRFKIEEINFDKENQVNIEDEERLINIYEELEKLPPKCREIFTMHYMEERKTSDIAQILGLSKRTIEAQLYKALKKLRSVLLPVIFLSILFFLL